MSDGSFLKNFGFGWKMGKLKPGITAEVAYQNQVAHQRQYLADRPAFAAYQKELHALAGLSKRWKLNAAVELMPDDPDGVWSEVCDGYGDNIAADLDRSGRTQTPQSGLARGDLTQMTNAYADLFANADPSMNPDSMAELAQRAAKRGLRAREYVAYKIWRGWIEHPPYPLTEFQAEDEAIEEAAHAAWRAELDKISDPHD